MPGCRGARTGLVSLMNPSVTGCAECSRGIRKRLRRLPPDRPRRAERARKHVIDTSIAPRLESKLDQLLTSTSPHLAPARSLPMRRPSIALALLLVAPLATAQVYKWTDAQGTTHFSQSPPPVGTKYS